MPKRKDIYILAKYTRVVRKGIEKKPGWNKDEANFQWTERVEITDRMKAQKRIDSNVIVNLSKKQVEKNSLAGDGTIPNFWLTWEYFIKHNGYYIQEQLNKLDDRLFKDLQAEVQLMKAQAQGLINNPQEA